MHVVVCADCRAVVVHRPDPSAFTAAGFVGHSGDFPLPDSWSVDNYKSAYTAHAENIEKMRGAAGRRLHHVAASTANVGTAFF